MSRNNAPVFHKQLILLSFLTEFPTMWYREIYKWNRELIARNREFAIVVGASPILPLHNGANKLGTALPI